MLISRISIRSVSFGLLFGLLRKWLARKPANILVVCLAFALTACQSDEESGVPNPLRIAVLPDQRPELLLERYGPLAEYLSEELGVEVELTVPQTYQHLLELFHQIDVDLAYFGGVTYVQAHVGDGAAPLVMRDVDAKFTSYFLVRADETATQISDMAGRRLGFGSRLSTSGHLMPRHYLRKSDINPEDFFEDIVYSGAHDRTALMVRDGSVDLGAANSVIVDSMFADGSLRPDEVRVLWETPPYADYVWALRKGFGEAAKIRLRDAFLKLSHQSEAHSRILDRLGARLFLPAGPNDFARLQALYLQTQEAEEN